MLFYIYLGSVPCRIEGIVYPHSAIMQTCGVTVTVNNVTRTQTNEPPNTLGLLHIRTYTVYPQCIINGFG